MKVELQWALKAHAGPLYALSPGRSESSIFSGGADNVVAEWNLDTGKTNAFAIRTDHTIYSLLHLGSQLVVGTINGGMHVIDLNERKELRHLKFHDKGIFHLLKGAENTLYAASADGRITHWNCDDWSLLRVISSPKDKVRRLALSPDGQSLAVCSTDGHIYRYDTQSEHQLIEALSGHEGAVNSLCFLPNGELLSGGKDAHIMRWVNDGKYLPVERIPAHNFAIYDLCHNGHGIVASASRDKTVKLWSSKNLQAPIRLDRKQFKGHTHSVNCAFWNAADQLVTCGDDASVLVWKVEA